MAATAHTEKHAHLAAESAALKKLLKEFTATLEQAAKSEGAEAAKIVSEKARDILSRASGLVDDLAKDAGMAKDAAIEGRHQLEESIRKQPLMAVGIAALAGFLLASLRRH
jgi:ElaB/YqjD/DUF883 family membrane-anchored ribosome-binding protein